jgi:hypothetical protein
MLSYDQIIIVFRIPSEVMLFKHMPESSPVIPYEFSTEKLLKVQHSILVDWCKGARLSDIF